MQLNQDIIQAAFWYIVNLVIVPVIGGAAILAQRNQHNLFFWLSKVQDQADGILFRVQAQKL